jgi:hypothetical protein
MQVVDLGAPPPTVASFSVSALESDVGRTIRLSDIVVSELARGDRVRLECHHCRGSRLLGPKVTRGSSLVFHSPLTLPRGSLLTVEVTRAGYYDRYKSYPHGIGGGARREGCIARGKITFTSCPP